MSGDLRGLTSALLLLGLQASAGLAAAQAPARPLERAAEPSGISSSSVAVAVSSSPPPPPPARYLPADHAYQLGEPQARWVHQIGYAAPLTVSGSAVSLGFFGFNYGLKHRAPYDRQGVLGGPIEEGAGPGSLPWSGVVGNEWGFEARLLTSVRSHSGITTTFGLSPTSSVRRRDSSVVFPSLVGLLLPEVAFVLLNPVEMGAPYRSEVYVRELWRLQFLIGEGILSVDAAPFVQLSFPLDHGSARLEGGGMIGVSCQLPPKI